MNCGEGKLKVRRVIKGLLVYESGLKYLQGLDSMALVVLKVSDWNESEAFGLLVKISERVMSGWKEMGTDGGSLIMKEQLLVV